MRRTTFALLAALILALSPLAARGGEEEAPSLPSMDDAERITQRYLSMSIAGSHAGGMGMRLGTLADGRILFEFRMRIQMTRSAAGDADDEFVIDQEALEVYDTSGQAIASTQVIREAGVVTTVRATYGAEYVSIVHEGPGGTYRKRLKLPEDHGLDYQVFQELIAGYEEGKEAHHAYQSLDASEQAFDPNDMWILGRTTFEHGGKTFPAWKVRQKTEDMLIEAVVGDDYLPFESTLMGGYMKATWVDEPPFDVKGGGWAVDVMVKVDRAVDRQFELEELEIRFVLDPPPSADEDPIFTDNEYQKVERESDGYRMVLLAGRPPRDFVAAPLPVKTDDAEIARYLEATPQAQSDHADLKALAARIVDGAKDSLDASGRIVTWVWANIAKRSGARGSATALEVLKSREGDCTEHATLTVALARAAGIPARAAGGLVYLVDGRGSPVAGYHAWSEVWVGRWVPVDATIPEVGTSARYARISIDEPGHEGHGGGILRALASKTRLEVLGWKHFGGERVEAKEAAGAR